MDQERLSKFTRQQLGLQRKGVGWGRGVQALILAKGSESLAAQIARERFSGTPWVADTLQKSAVSAMDSTDGALVYATNLSSEFAAAERPLTINDRLNLSRVPFNVRFARVNAATIATFIAQGGSIPVSSLNLTAVTLTQSKCAAIFVITNELANNSSPEAASMIAIEGAAATAQALNQAMWNPDSAAVTNANPEAITHGITAIASTGNTATALIANAKTAQNQLTDAGISLDGCAWITSERLGTYIGQLTNSQGSLIFPTVGATGGSWLNIPMITSGSALESGSPNEGWIALVQPQMVALADEGASTVEISENATIQMDTAPTQNVTSPTASNVVSMFGTNSVAVKVTRYVSWARRRDSAIAIIRDIVLA